MKIAKINTSELMFISFIDHEKAVIQSNDMYTIVSNGLNNCLGTDSFLIFII